MPADGLPDLIAEGDLILVHWPRVHRRGWVIVTAVKGAAPSRRFNVMTEDGPGEATENEVHGWRAG